MHHGKQDMRQSRTLDGRTDCQRGVICMSFVYTASYDLIMSYYAALREPHLVVSVCLSVPCLRFSRNKRSAQKLIIILVKTLRWTSVTRGQIWGITVKGQCHWEWKCKNLFLRIYSSKVDRFMPNEDQNDQRPILYISPNTFCQCKNSLFFL